MNGGIHDAMNLSRKLVSVLLHGESSQVLERYERQRRPIAIEYINANTARNKKQLEEQDPVQRQKNQDEWRAIASDKQRSLAYLKKTSMIDALEKSEALA